MGTWEFVSTSPPNGPSGSFAFDGFGNWIGGSAAADLCTGSTMSGTYTFDGTTLELVTIHDSSVCNPTWIMTFDVAFNDACGSAQLANHIDNCTGGHFELGQGMTLTRR